jgi:hypothetical protein
MSPSHKKLKPSYIQRSLFLLFIAWLLFGRYLFSSAVQNAIYVFLSLFLLLILLGCFLRTKNFSVLGMLMNIALMFFVFSFILYTGKTPKIFPVFVFPVTVFIAFILIFYSDSLGPFFSFWQRHFRYLLELAASSVQDTTNGFTNRPYPYGRARILQDRLKGFAKYLNKNLIATAFFEPHRTILVFSNGLFQYIPFLKPNLQRETHVVFEQDGHMSVHIAKKDYKKYQDELAFDQLCSSLGKLIEEFLYFYERGDEQFIISKLKGEFVSLKGAV